MKNGFNPKQNMGHVYKFVAKCNLELGSQFLFAYSSLVLYYFIYTAGIYYFYSILSFPIILLENYLQQLGRRKEKGGMGNGRSGDLKKEKKKKVVGKGKGRGGGGCVALRFIFLVTVSRGGGNDGPPQRNYPIKLTQWGHVLSFPKLTLSFYVGLKIFEKKKEGQRRKYQMR